MNNLSCGMENLNFNRVFPEEDNPTRKMRGVITTPIPILELELKDLVGDLNPKLGFQNSNKVNVSIQQEPTHPKMLEGTVEAPHIPSGNNHLVLRGSKSP